MKRHLGVAFAMVGLACLGLAPVAAASAGASTARPAHSAAAPASVSGFTRHIHENLLALADQAKTSTLKPASVSPVASFSPACYGDARNISYTSGTLRPSSFGAFYNCPHKEWTFEVQTADTWTRNALGDWFLLIDTNGTGGDNCGGFEYQAYVLQTDVAGQFVGGVQRITGDPSGNNCTMGSLVGTFTITANSVAISFPASAIDNGNSPSLLWTSTLQTHAEEINGTGGDDVPKGQFCRL